MINVKHLESSFVNLDDKKRSLKYFFKTKR